MILRRRDETRCVVVTDGRRAAAGSGRVSGGLVRPAPPNPNDPQSYLRLLTNADQQEMNMVYSAVHNQIMAECNATDHMGSGAKNAGARVGN